MSVVDIVLIVLVLAYGIAGYTQGLIVGVWSFIGFVGGAVLGLSLGPRLLTSLTPGLGTAVLGLILVLVLATVGQAVAAWIGSLLRSRVRWSSMRFLDSLGGALFSMAALLLAAWAIGLAAASSSIPSLSAAVRDSQVLRAVDGQLPASARTVVGRFRDLVGAGAFPSVVLPFEPEPISGVREPAPGTARALPVRAASRSVVKVLGEASTCGRVLEGSGFVVGPNRVMTNAHVVAGTTKLAVVDRDGVDRRAFVVHFDSRTDVAVLAVPRLGLPALQFAPQVRVGQPAAVLGYPRNGPFVGASVRVRQERTLIGEDIYGKASVSRDVVALRGSVVPGNSGGPVVGDRGRVLGVVFAASLTDTDTGYALAASEVRGAVRAGAARRTPVPSGACVPE